LKKKPEMRIDKRKLRLRALGISNWCFDEKTKEKSSVQFYDYDFPDKSRKIPRDDLLKIKEIFPYDAIMYETKHGVHFISFSLLKGTYRSKARVLETSKSLGLQDYWTEANDLTLRVSAKWQIKRFKRDRIVVSEKPMFKGVLKEPNFEYRISSKHLEFYKKYMDLPNWIYKLYDNCDKKDLRIKVYHYKTRD